MCKVPVDLESREPVVLFESSEESASVTQIEIGEGLMELEGTDRHYVRIPLGNPTTCEITVRWHTPLGSKQSIASVIEAEQQDLRNSGDILVSQGEDSRFSGTGEHPQDRLLVASAG